jgi:hypothetical protein
VLLATSLLRLKKNREIESEFEFEFEISKCGRPGSQRQATTEFKNGFLPASNMKINIH